MKIAMIGLRGIPAKSGGVENVVENLAPRLVKMGCDVTVYCRMQYCKDRPRTYKGVKLLYLPTLNTKYTEAIIHSKLSTLNAMFKDYDIVHYHAMGNAIFTIFPRILGKKTIITLHGLDYEREKWGFAAKAFLRLSEKTICKFPNQVISVSEKIKKHYKQKYNKDIIYIPNGVLTEKPLPINHLKRYNLKKDGYILYLGRIVPEKGIHTLIKAYKNIKTEKSLVIAGDATHTNEYLKELKELSKDDKRIIFTGPLYDEDKIEAFSNCMFFVLPSTIEGMPIVLLEAMSFGICVLTSDIEENLEVVKDLGYTFKVNDSDDLKNKLEYMLNHKSAAHAKGERSRSEVKKLYDWDKIAVKTLNTYKEVLNE